MTTDGEFTAVVDRIEETEDGELVAVLLLEADADVVDELVVPTDTLPEPAEADTVYRVSVGDGELIDAVPDNEATDCRADAAQDRFDRLAERPPAESGEDPDDSA
jgi:hypothetical protein